MGRVLIQCGGRREREPSHFAFRQHLGHAKRGETALKICLPPPLETVAGHGVASGYKIICEEKKDSGEARSPDKRPPLSFPFVFKPSAIFFFGERVGSEAHCSLDYFMQAEVLLSLRPFSAVGSRQKIFFLFQRS